MGIRSSADKGDSIALIGVENWGEPLSVSMADLQKLIRAIRNLPAICVTDVLRYCFRIIPNTGIVRFSKTTDIDLTLSGHTHAMQMVFKIFGYEWSPSKWRYPQWEGMYERVSEKGDTTRLYVNIGCGEVGIPLRFGTAYPEITEITLKTENDFRYGSVKYCDIEFRINPRRPYEKCSCRYRLVPDCSNRMPCLFDL